MPTRSGGSFLVRLAMWCSVVMSGTAGSIGFRAAPTGWPASGAKAWRVIVVAARARGRRPREWPAASRARMRWPALWPSGTDLIAACTMFSAQPKAKASSTSRALAPVRAPASAKATGQVGAGCSAASAATRASSPSRWRSQSASERPICSVCWRSSLVSRVCSTQALSAAMRAASSRAPGGDGLRRRPPGRRAPGSGAAGRRSQCAALCFVASRGPRRRPLPALRNRRSRRPAAPARPARSAAAARRQWPWIVAAVVMVVHGRGAWPRARAPCAAVGAALGLERRAARRCTIRCMARSMSASTWSGSIFRWSGFSSIGTWRLPRW